MDGKPQVSIKDFELLFPDDVEKKHLADFQKAQENAIKGRRVVNVTSGHGGVGKTHRLFNEWKTLPDLRKVYMSHSHKFLSEQASRVSDVRHIFGLRLICPVLQDSENKHSFLFNLMLERGFTNKFVCATCDDLEAYDRDQCPYQQQFLNPPNTVMAPVEYSNLKFLEKYAPNIIAVDDCLFRKCDHPKRETLEALLHLYLMLTDSNQRDLPLSAFLQLPNFEDLLIRRYAPKHSHFLKHEIEEMIANTNNKKAGRFFADIDPQEFVRYKTLSQIHGWRKQFSTPYLFYLFDYVCEHEDCDLTIIEALGQGTPTESFLDRLNQRHFKETHNVIEFDYNNIEPNLPLPKSTIYRCMGRNDSWYPTSSSIVESETIRNNIKKYIQVILQDYYRHNLDTLSIGLIIPKRCKPSDFFDDISNVTTLTFGNLRGMNELEHCNVLFVVGTYLIHKEDMVKRFSLYYARDPSTDEMVEDKPHNERYHYKDKDMEILRWSQEEYESYQAVMRARPLNHEVNIFCFGLIPDEIPDCIEKEVKKFMKKNGE